MKNKIMFYISLFEKTTGETGLRIRTNLRKDPMTNLLFPEGVNSLHQFNEETLKNFKENLIASIKSVLLFDFKNDDSSLNYFKVVFEREDSVEGRVWPIESKFHYDVVDIWSLDSDEQRIVRRILFEGM